MKFDEKIAKDRVNKFRERKIVFSMKNIWKFAKKYMKKSQQNLIIYANKHRILASDYQVEDQIWLFIKNIQIDRSFKKLDHKMLESFKILKKRDSSYKLELFVEMNIYSVFHISLLRKNFENFLSKQIISSSSFVVIDDEEKFDVENIIDSRLTKRSINKKLQYKIKWVRHSSNRKWYSIENFENAKEIVADYHQRYLDKSDSHSFAIQFLFISLMTHLIKSFIWARKSIQKTKNMIEDILNKMKIKMKFSIIKQTSILNVKRNYINVKTANQDCFVIKVINVERILFNQKQKKNNVTISYHSFSQKISIKKN
jgi:predicted metal-dependent hydrolase